MEIVENEEAKVVYQYIADFASQKLVKTKNRGKMSTNRGGESGLDFD